jgi:maltooligosyltrehalose trehalohydrolase
LDATQQIFDGSPRHILAEINERIREAVPGRQLYVVGENEPQDTRLVRPPEKGGYGLDALWNDDFHHSARVALTGHNEAYYSDYMGSPQEFISAAKWGFLYQGQRYSWQKKPRGTPALDLAPSHFVTFLENHDQVANSGRGLRLHQLTSPGRYRAMTALLLLGPGTPMLFQGQEFGSSRPFLYFTDHKPDLAQRVHKGRLKFLSQFDSLSQSDALNQVTEPHSMEAFEQCKLNDQERRSNVEIIALHHDLLRLRREDPAFHTQKAHGLDGAVLGPEAFVLRFFREPSRDRLLIVNLGRDLRLRAAPEPLLAPPEGKTWKLLWSSEDWRYGGSGLANLENDKDIWFVPAEAAVVLAPH